MKKFNLFREESIEEVLKSTDPAGKWIHDFVHSDNPKFAGKSKEQRIRMALGASYGAKKANEGSEICSTCERDPCICDDSHGFVSEAEAEEETAIDKGEYDYEGQMARTQLQTTMRNCKDLIGMIEDGDNMPEWVQSKITLAQDYITSVRDYLQSKEELEENNMVELGDLANKKVLKHRVLVTYSDPKHTMVSQRKEQIQKHVRIPSTNKQGETVYQGDAVDYAKQFVKKQGYKVHDAEHVGLVKVNEGVAEGAPIVVAQAPIHIRNPKKAPQPYRNQGDIVPPTKPPSTEKRGVKGRPGQRPMPTYEEVVEEGREDKIKQLKADHATAVHWSKNETSPQKREAARQKAEKIKRHLDTQYKQGVAEANLSELNKDTVYSYAKKADKDQDKQSTITGKAYLDNDPKTANKAHHKFSMRAAGLDRAEKRLNKEGVAEGITYEPSMSSRPSVTSAGHTIVGNSFHSNGTKHANIMKHGQTGKYFAAGGSSSHPVKSTTFHDTPEDAAKSKKPYVKEENIAEAQTKEQIDDVHKTARYLSAKEGVVQHVNKDPETGEHHVSDWYHHENTVATYNNGRKSRG
jgi:hypothetical protein